MFGSHLSIAGSLCNALREAEALRMETVQIFTKNQQQWKAPPLPDSAVREWLAEVARLGWARTGDAPGRTTAHASYLINLASPDDELWHKSIDLMRIEIERCEALEIPFLVHHPGSPGAERAAADPAFGISRIADAYTHLLRDTAGFRTICCLENTVGAGAQIGAKLEQLADLRRLILERAPDPAEAATRIGYCFDTCHAHAAGYDMASRDSAQAVLEQFDQTCSLGLLHILHLNDSKGKLGSRLDRHEHIGAGTIGSPKVAESGFAAVVNHPKLAGKPKILETPKGKNSAGTPYDSLNLRRLRKLTTGVEPIKGTRSKAKSRPRAEIASGHSRSGTATPTKIPAVHPTDTPARPPTSTTPQTKPRPKGGRPPRAAAKPAPKP